MPRLPGALGRRPSSDERDRLFPMQAALPAAEPERNHRYWWNKGWHGDQGSLPQCVAYAWLHFLEDGPVTQAPRAPGIGPIFNPHAIYQEAQRADEFPGTNYDGTSVRAGAKVLQERHAIGTYRWGTTLEDLKDGVLQLGPCVVGTWWTDRMFWPDQEGFIRYEGRPVGGHAFLVNGCNVREEKFRIKNSWGRSWGQDGHAWIPFDDMARLIRDDGEVCIATEVTSR